MNKYFLKAFLDYKITTILVTSEKKALKLFKNNSLDCKMIFNYVLAYIWICSKSVVRPSNQSTLAASF